jgi:DNA-binding NtrC family response regulator
VYIFSMQTLLSKNNPNHGRIIVVEKDSGLRALYRSDFGIHVYKSVERNSGLEFYCMISRSTFGIAILAVVFPEQGEQILLAYQILNTITHFEMMIIVNTLENCLTYYHPELDVIFRKPFDFKYQHTLQPNNLSRIPNRVVYDSDNMPVAERSEEENTSCDLVFI